MNTQLMITIISFASIGAMMINGYFALILIGMGCLLSLLPSPAAK